jgi:hypothetical protein
LSPAIALGINREKIAKKEKKKYENILFRPNKNILLEKYLARVIFTYSLCLSIFFTTKIFRVLDKGFKSPRIDTVNITIDNDNSNSTNNKQ